MDIARAFSFVFDDEEWIKKVLIGAVLALTGIGMIPIIGYGMEVARRVVNGHPQPLPEWDEWGTKIMEGFMTAVVGFIWTLPITIISSCVWVILVPILSLDESGNIAGVVTALLSVCVGFIILLYVLVLMLVLPAALTHYAVTGEFGAAFRFGEIVAMVRENLGAYLMVLLVSILASIVASLGSVVLGCGFFFTLFYSALVNSHAFGQAYRIAVGNVESEVELSY